LGGKRERDREKKREREEKKEREREMTKRMKGLVRDPPSIF
jgi:hypothetical protein